MFRQPEVPIDSKFDFRFREGKITEESFVEASLRSGRARGLVVQARLKPVQTDRPTHALEAVHWQVDLISESFQKLRPLIARFGAEVPVPLHVLEGALRLQWQGVFARSAADSQVSTFSVEVDLASREQKIRASGQGRGEVRGLLTQKILDLHVDLDFLMHEMEVVAPPLRFQAPPRLVPDRRFQGQRPSAPSRFPVRVHYDVRLRTEQPLLIKTDLTRAPVPISADLRVRSGQSPEGRLQIHRVPLDMLRRDIELEQLSIELAASGRSPALDGRLRVRSGGYLVNVLIDGEFQRPRIRLTSEPPLSEDEIHSVLLFGSPLASLGMEEVSSVGQFKGALVARAVSLASLYFLVATPVQFVSFNPQTGAFGAQVRLPRNLALRLGIEDEEAQQAVLRKRINREFYLETEFRHPKLDATDDQGASLSTYLMWFKRY